MTSVVENHESLPLALSQVIQEASAEASKQGRLIAFKILHALPTWISGDLTDFSAGLKASLANQLVKSRSREMYVICTSSRSATGEVEIDFTATDLPGFKLSSDAKAFYSRRLVPYSERETFKHLLPPATDTSHMQVDEELLTGYCILVVDDSEDSLEYETRLIERFGGHCQCARTGAEAVEKALAHHFDVVLMDIKMPTLDGNDAMKSLAEQRYKVPVVALSAYASVQERKASLKNGFADYLSKPIIPGQLLKTIARVTHRSLPIVHAPAQETPVPTV